MGTDGGVSPLSEREEVPMERYLAIIALRILILRSSAENGATYRGCLR